ncbi:hypothetical protein BY458DRAFT_545882 [Sporodiniella umbellata]|nr:hypothetical protein BY458DRAFT_545882 [Sporodiniella umbellata]
MKNAQRRVRTDDLCRVKTSVERDMSNAFGTTGKSSQSNKEAKLLLSCDCTRSTWMQARVFVSKMRPCETKMNVKHFKLIKIQKPLFNMNVSELLNPLINSKSRCTSSSLLSKYQPHIDDQVVGKSRSRFSEYEDNIIREGVTHGLTWGQISELLPHRKRATCFNRYRTLQGIRKSRKLGFPLPHQGLIYPKGTAYMGETGSEVSTSPISSDDELFYSPAHQHYRSHGAYLSMK